MDILNRDYKIKVDIKTGKIENNNIIFALSDQNVSNILIEFTNQNEKVDLTGFTILANILKPDNLMTVEEVIIKDCLNGVAELNIPIIATLDQGHYDVEIKMKKGEDISHTNKFKYFVRDTLCGEIDDSIIDDSNYNLLIRLVDNVNQLESEIKKSEELRIKKEDERISNETLRNIQETNRQVNDLNRETRIDQLITKTDEKIDEAVSRVDNAIASGTMDLEVKDARGKCSSLRERLEQIERDPYVIWETVEG